MSYPTEKIPALLDTLKATTNEFRNAYESTQCLQENQFIADVLLNLDQYQLWLADLLKNPDSHGPHPCTTCPQWKDFSRL